MSSINQAEILKQMGITQWLLRDTAQQQGDGEPGVTAEPVLASQTDEPPSHAASAEAVINTAVQPSQSAPATTPVSQQVLSVSPATVQADSLQALRDEVQNCEACSLATSRKQVVFGSGPQRADWLFIGEAPGQQEDRQGLPFVGRAGSLLTQMLLALGQPRDQVYIANTVKCRPPGNRDPLPEELRACEPFLLKQIEFLQPRIIVALGRISAQALLKNEQPLGRMRGQVYQYGPGKIPLVVTYHPAYLLRNPADKAKVWQDLLLANRQLTA